MQGNFAATTEDPPLPRLRDDLRLFPGPPALDGSPTWSVFDPMRGAYFRISATAMEMLSRWSLGRAGAVAVAVTTETALAAKGEDVTALAQFLRANDLTASDDPAAVERLVQRFRSRRRGWLHQAIHGYLFFRIPILRPDRFLDAVQPLVEPFFSKVWQRIVIGLGLLGLFLASRQWDVFISGLKEMASWETAAELAAALAVIKILHEFGHACTAKRYGCPVPTMGVAFLVLWPVLYTDATHAYRLTSRDKRLEIAGAGIMVELFVAALATFIWAILPDGALRQAAHIAAVVSWVGTLAINLNPMMRFDGYYLLADALNMPNLQDRAFALAKWRLRTALFGLQDPPPETFTPNLRRFLIGYAVSTWVYRFFLFLGIAVLVYNLAFKILGIFLMAVEVVYFIALPIWRELAAWWKLRRRVGFNRHLIVTLMGSISVLVLLAWPISWPVKAPAALRPLESAGLHAPVPAQVKSVHLAAEDPVTAGAPLITLKSPELDFETERAAQRIAALATLVERESAVAEAADRVSLLQEELRSAEALLIGLTALQTQLILTAPLSGAFVDPANPLRPGQWVRPEQVLGRVVALGRRVTAYIAADDLSRVAVGAPARFIPIDPAAAALSLRVESIAAANADVLDILYLSASRGGPIPTTPVPTVLGKSGRGAERPTVPVYRVVLAPTDSAPAAAPVRDEIGRVFIDAPPLSLIQRAWRAAAAVFIRESGF